MPPLGRSAATALVAVALPVLLAACSGPAQPLVPTSARAPSASASASTAGPFDVRGRVSVPIHLEDGAPAPKAGADCEASDDFSDIEASGQVVLRSSSGRILGEVALGPGRALVDAATPKRSRCEFPFAFRAVPPGSSYRIAVGEAFRGTVRFTGEELQAGPTITVG